ncbi:MAG: hypothetical protein LBN02_08090 [Oscillospiraceae bacterium]|nr:hypothetical protein [Oscillospiraceae bacterium]
MNVLIDVLPICAFRLQDAENSMELTIIEVERRSYRQGYFVTVLLDTYFGGLAVQTDHRFTHDNLCGFYSQLRDCCDKVNGEVRFPAEDWGTLMFTMSFTEAGHVIVNGEFHDYDIVRGSTKRTFELQTEHTAIRPMLADLNQVYRLLVNLK